MKLIRPLSYVLDKLTLAIIAIYEKNNDATLAEYCELLADETGEWSSVSAMCRALQKLELIRKKNDALQPSAQSERVQLLRQEYWSTVSGIDLKNLVFQGEIGVLMGLMRTYARALPGLRTYDFKPFYRGSKVSVIGAIPSTKVLAVMTIDGSMDATAFKVYVANVLIPELWSGAVVVMDNLTAHKVEAIELLDLLLFKG